MACRRRAIAVEWCFRRECRCWSWRGLGFLWKRRSRSYIERTGDEVCVGWRRRGVVVDAIGVAMGVGCVYLRDGGVEVGDRGVFDGIGNGSGGGRDVTAAYEGRTGRRGRGEEGDVGGRGMAAACSDRCSWVGFVLAGKHGDCGILAD
jgi:hypothetical protein